ncbi:MAG: hypothetical protein ABR583_07600 [Gaiellaceae bacterium]
MGLRGRLVAAFAYVLLLVIVAVVLPLALNLERRAEAEAKAHAESQAHVIAASVSGRLKQRGELQRVTNDAAADLGGRVIIVGRRGKLLADSAGSGLRGTSYRSRPEITAALTTGKTVQERRRSDSLGGQELLVTAAPVMLEGKPTGAVRVTQSFDAIRDAGRRGVKPDAGQSGGDEAGETDRDHLESA